MYYVNKGQIFHRIAKVDIIGKPSDVQKCFKFKASLLHPQFFRNKTLSLTYIFVLFRLEYFWSIPNIIFFSLVFTKLLPVKLAFTNKNVSKVTLVQLSIGGNWKAILSLIHSVTLVQLSVGGKQS